MSLPFPYDADAPVTELRIADAPVVRTVAVDCEDYPVFKLPQLMDGVFSHLAGALAERGIHPTGAAFSLHHRFPVDTADLEVGFPVDGALEGTIELPSGFTAEASSLPAGRVAMRSHLGGYGGLGDAWGAFMEAVGEAGEQACFPIWELYVTNPAETKDPSTLRTDLFSVLEG